MITPKFKIDQNDSHLLLQVKLPYVKISSIDLYVDGRIFKLSLHPYFLNLEFNQELEYEGVDQASYDHNTYLLNLSIKKKNIQENFDDLDMFNKLIVNNKTKEPYKKVNIEVIDQETKVITEEMDQLQISTKFNYGFGNQIHGIFQERQEELSVLAQLNPDITSQEQRWNIKKEIEDREFEKRLENDDAHEEDEIVEILQQNFQIQTKEKENLQLKEIITNKLNFSLIDILQDKEYDYLLTLKKKEYILNEKELANIQYQLLDILLAWIFDQRINDFEENCESAWNVSTISSTFSCFISFENIEEVLKSFYRRTLTFPLYRNWSLSKQSIEDLKAILLSGKSLIVLILIKIALTFNKQVPYYMFSQLYLNDYIIYTQSLEKQNLLELISQIQNVNVKPEDIELPINQLCIKIYFFRLTAVILFLQFFSKVEERMNSSNLFKFFYFLIQPVNISAYNSSSVFPVNGNALNNSTQQITPVAHISTVLVSQYFFKTVSGDIQRGVPQYTFSSTLGSTIVANPKSTSFMIFFFSSQTKLSNFISL